MSIDITTLAIAKEYTNRMIGSGGAGSIVNGKDGITPHIGDNGNWFIGTTDTGVSAEGEDGGHYIPVVTQPSSDKLQISFTPSKSDMPEVNPVTVNLPVSEDSGENVPQMEPADDDLPKLFFTVDGWLPITKDEGKTKCHVRYISKTADFSRPVTMAVQGGSSATAEHYKKKNYTMTPYKDDAYEEKDKLAFKDWPAMNKFVLKASWVTPSHIRNPGTAEIAGQVVRSRADYESLPEELRNSPNQGATHGFAVRVWVNGLYWGIYELIVAKDKIFGQDKDNPAHSIVGADNSRSEATAFATTNPVIDNNWSEELQDEMSAETKTGLENFIKFVAGSTDDEFVANAENIFDVQSVIDADIVFRLFCVVDNLTRNQIFYKYDQKWYEGFWDLDAVLGLPPLAGGAWFGPETPFQEGYVAYKETGTPNLLYKRVEALFAERFKARYWELRSGVLSIPNVLSVYERRMDVLKSYDGLLAEDYASTTGRGEFTGMPNKEKDTIQQIRQFVHDRWAYMDGVMSIERVPATSITLSASTLTFDSTDAQTLVATVEPADSTDTVVWESSDTGVATVKNGVVTPIESGNATITATAGSVSAECAVAVADIASSLPDGHTELEYVVTVGKGPYVDTGVYATANTAAEYKVRPTTAAYNVHVLSGDEMVFPNIRTKLSSNAGVYVKRMGTTTTEDWIVDAYSDHEVSAFMSGDTYTVDGRESSYCAVGTAEVDTRELRIGGNPVSPNVNNDLNGRIYYVRIYENGVLIRNYIPARNAEGVVGFYEAVAGEFHGSDNPDAAYTAPEGVS